jgi:hypothetical protein
MHGKGRNVLARQGNEREGKDKHSYLTNKKEPQHTRIP